MNVLLTAFDGTAQPIPGARGVTIWYLETGFQTVPPRDKRRFYRGRENDPEPIPAVAPGAPDGEHPVDQATQRREPCR